MAVVALAAFATTVLSAGDRAVRRSAAMTTAVRDLSLALLAGSSAPGPAVTSLAVLAYGLVGYAPVGGGAAVAVLRRRG